MPTGRGSTFGQIHDLLTLPSIINMSMRGDSTMAQPITAPSFAAYASSSAARSIPVANVAAGACSIVPHGHSDPKLRVSYSGESAVSH